MVIEARGVVELRRKLSAASKPPDDRVTRKDREDGAASDFFHSELGTSATSFPLKNVGRDRESVSRTFPDYDLSWDNRVAGLEVTDLCSQAMRAAEAALRKLPEGEKEKLRQHSILKIQDHHDLTYPASNRIPKTPEAVQQYVDMTKTPGRSNDESVNIFFNAIVDSLLNKNKRIQAQDRAQYWLLLNSDLSSNSLGNVKIEWAMSKLRYEQPESKFERVYLCNKWRRSILLLDSNGWVGSGAFQRFSKHENPYLDWLVEKCGEKQ